MNNSGRKGRKNNQERDKERDQEYHYVRDNKGGILPGLLEFRLEQLLVVVGEEPIPSNHPYEFFRVGGVDHGQFIDMVKDLVG